jgi:uncharacterized phage protein (TIGR01671 family)
MRQIKFRAWDKIKNVMWESPVLHFTVANTYNGTQGIGNAFNETNSEIMQFTGLTDKNGKEIYEGDTLIKGDPMPLDGQSQEQAIIKTIKPLTVFFHEGAFKCSASSKGKRYNLTGLLIRQNGLKVIGNIHENK